MDQTLEQKPLKQGVIGHQNLFVQWSRLFEKDQLTGSFMFVGPAGVGKRKSAWAMIQEALCTKKTTNFQACGQCGSCRRVAAHQHESVLYIEPDGPMIKVEQAHQIIHFLQLKSLGEHRFVLVDEAHKMNATTANSLLKTLEEPASGTTLILTAPSLTSVLPTIRSRLRVFHFQPVPLEEIRERKTVPDWALEASLGRFDLLEALETPAERQFRSQWADFLCQFLLSAETLTDDGWRDALKNKDDFKLALDLWLKLIRDAILFQAGEKKSLLTLDLSAQLQKLSAIPVFFLQKIGQDLIELQKEMNFNKDPVLSLESLFIRFQEARLS